MKRILYTLLAAVAVLTGNYFSSGSTLEANVETPTPVPSPTLVPLPGTVVPTPVDGPTAIPTPVEQRDPYGELYFTIITPKEYYPPETPPPYDESTLRLARLPGSCVVGLETCPEAEIVKTPFNMKDVHLTESKGLEWSPDNRYGLLVTHPEDELSGGRSQEELNQLQKQSPLEFEVAPSTLYSFDAESNTWSELYRAERKFFYTPQWSPDGQWIAFQVRNSVWGFHKPDADDGIYIIRPDGSELHQVGNADAFILGWIGNSILVREMKDLYPSTEYFMKMLSLDGELKPLFDSSRPAYYVLSPDGGILLAGDLREKEISSSIKSIDALALDGSVIRTFAATFPEGNNGFYPIAWSPDGSLIAFANSRRVYVQPGDGPGLQNGMIGIPPDFAVYTADDTYTEPSFWNLQFSKDNKYLLMDVYEGIPHFAVVSLETGQTMSLEIKGMTESEQASSFSWRQ